MRDRTYAILGDIHGNWEALCAVLEDAAAHEASSYVCVGDIVGYNANPAECLDRVRELEAVVVRGNHDHYCAHDECLEDFHPLAANVVDWTRRQLTPEQIAYLRELPLQRNVAGFSVVHSTLDMPDKWGYVFDALDAEAHFNYQMATVCFYGHTHVPIVFEKRGRVTRSTYSAVRISLGHKYFLNVGSVGQPRDGDPRAAYVLYNMKEKLVTLRRVAYDLGKTQDKIHKVGLPDRLAKRLAVGK